MSTGKRPGVDGYIWANANQILITKHCQGYSIRTSHFLIDLLLRVVGGGKVGSYSMQALAIKRYSGQGCYNIYSVPTLNASRSTTRDFCAANCNIHTAISQIQEATNHVSPRVFDVETAHFDGGAGEAGAVNHSYAAGYGAHNHIKPVHRTNEPTEIDSNFSRAHRIITTSILPLVEQYGEHSKAVWEASRVSVSNLSTKSSSH